ncbi:hypothetical protein GFL77_39365, partial [Rhizobium leguminosarum bv. viciae]|nr:hypothetical protein [Rhizobium leguminosarum bv. viciae]
MAHSQLLGRRILKRVDRSLDAPSGQDTYRPHPESDLDGGKDGSTFSSVIQGLRSDHRELGAPSAQRPPSASDVGRRTSADPSVNTRERQAGSRYLPHGNAPNWEESSSRSGAEGRSADLSRSSLRSASSSHRQSVSGLDHRPKRRRLDDVAAQSTQTAISEQQSN